MYFKFKEYLDCLISFIGLIFLSPICLIISIAIKLDTRGPILFIQKRIGKDGEPFYMYKFRTMVVNAQNIGTGLYSFKDDSRVTRVGKILRKTSLDEIPQLVNILRGDMAIIGPRPPVLGGFPDYKSLSPEYKKRFSVRPGITGLAQVIGRNEFSWDEKIKYDNEYIDKVKRYGLFLDMKILALTVKRVFSMKGVTEKPVNRERDLFNH